MMKLKASFTISPYILTILLLSLANLIVYWNVQNFEFIILDDPAYVLSNPMVQNGLSLNGLKWAFATFDYNTANWHPLTWLSLMMDRQFYGLNAGGYHWTNLLFHMANTLLLFVVLHRMTKAMWRSAFVAVFFAIHPLHIESVAWVSARKDVLSTLFLFLAIWSYLQYVEHSDRKWYFATTLLFIFGLMAKPMVVTLPFVLLLLDYWPLRRFKQQKTSIHNVINGRIPSLVPLQRSASYLFMEKIPFLLLSLISSVITYMAQQSGEAVQSLTNLPLTSRIANAFIAYFTYISKTIWPHNLAVFYPLPDSWPLWHIFLAFALIISVTAIVFFLSKSRPYFFTGWFWYVGTLVPVIGLVQVGTQSMADRYTYIPLTGLFIIIIWGAADVIKKRTSLKIYLSSLSVSMIFIFMIASWLQIQYWQNSLTLFRHTLSVTKENYFAHNGIGIALRMNGELSEAENHFKEALRIRPKFAQAHANIGHIYYQRNEMDLAAAHFIEAIRLSPRFQEARFNLGHVYLLQKKYNEAISEYNQILRVQPYHAEAHNYLGVALICQGNIEGAIREFEAALSIHPKYAKARINLANAREIKKRLTMNHGGKSSNSPVSNEVLEKTKKEKLFHKGEHRLFQRNNKTIIGSP